mmetsp:Transcript_131447/g.281066  ORF Transcript_131447/g.281066 Transcript_131447/m.281066 type:complete len:541 (+) Transcript_131447:102-1724(+)
MGNAQRGRYRLHPLDEDDEISSVKVKRVFSHSSSAWLRVKAASVPTHASLFSPKKKLFGSRSPKKGTGGPAPRPKAPALEVFLKGGDTPNVVVKDSSGDGWYDSVEYSGAAAPGEEQRSGSAGALPMLAVDVTEDGKADAILIDTRGKGRYDRVINRNRAPLSFLATMASASTDTLEANLEGVEMLRGAAMLVPDAAARPLAPGWERVQSQSTGLHYYVHNASHRVTWDASEAEMPVPPSPCAAGQRPLAPGWTRRRSKSTDRQYFFHAESGRTTWDSSEAELQHPSALDYPSYWKHADRRDGFLELVNTSSAFRHVQMLLASTFMFIRTRDRRTRLPIALEALKIWRVENALVWHRYATHRAFLQELATTASAGDFSPCEPLPKTSELLPSELTAELDAGVNEVYLFHGTSPQGALGIKDVGFDISKATGTACYGPGVYLTECSSKSDEYAQEDTDGLHAGHSAVLLCRVLLGRVLNWHTEASADLSQTWSSGRHDSILGDRVRLRGTYREFVLPPESCQGAYPEYIIIYRRRYEDSEN